MAPVPSVRPHGSRPVRLLGCTAAGLGVAVTLGGAPPPAQGSGASFRGGEFKSVSAVSASDVWAVGDLDTGGPAGLMTLAARWNGTRWVRVPTPSPGRGVSGSTLSGVSAVSATEAWAVGGYETRSNAVKTLVLHWNGTRWTRVAVPSPGGTRGSRLAGVSARSASDAWAVGCYDFNVSTGESITLVLHWDGTRWAQMPSPTPGAAHTACLAGVSALSATDAWAVGYFIPTTTSGAIKPLLLHWNGTRWARVASPTPGGTLVTTLSGVAAISPSDAWAVGDVFDGTRQIDRTLVLHWNGTGWGRVASPSPGGFSALFGVTAVSATEAWAVGLGNGSLILHWNGTRWIRILRPAPGPAARSPAS